MATQLVAVTEDGKYIVNPKASSMFDQYDTIKVISIVGPHRSGKSFLLSQLFPMLNTETRTSGGRSFQVGSSINACTKGIWCYRIDTDKDSKHLYTSGSDKGVKSCIVVLDSEGINSQEATKLSSNHDCNVFTLCLLLSSLLIYNSRGTIDQQALRNLKLVSKMSTLFYGNSPKSPEVSKIRGRRCHPPHLCWVLRDFALQLEKENGVAITANDYLESNISTHPELRSAFSSRSCFTLPRPCVNERDLQNLSRSSTKIRLEFSKQLDKLKSHIHQESRSKTFMGQTVTGSMLNTLLHQYTSTLNQKSLPKIEDSWTSMVSIKSRQLMTSIPQTFKDEVLHILQDDSKWDTTLIEQIITDQTKKYKDKFMSQSLDPTMEESKIMTTLQSCATEIRDTIQSLCDIWIDNKLTEVVKHFQVDTTSDHPISTDASIDFRISLSKVEDIATISDHSDVTVGNLSESVECTSIANSTDMDHTADVCDVEPRGAITLVQSSVNWTSLYDFWSTLIFPCQRLERLFLHAYKSYIQQTVECAHRDLEVCGSQIKTLTQQCETMHDARTECEMKSVQLQKSHQTIQNLQQQREDSVNRYNMVLEKSEEFSKQLQLKLQSANNQRHQSDSRVNVYQQQTQCLSAHNQSLCKDKELLQLQISKLCQDKKSVKRKLDQLVHITSERDVLQFHLKKTKEVNDLLKAQLLSTQEILNTTSKENNLLINTVQDQQRLLQLYAPPSMSTSASTSFFTTPSTSSSSSSSSSSSLSFSTTD